MTSHLSWKTLIIELLTICIIASIVAIFTGHLLLCILIATLTLLFWHFYHLVQLSHWLWSENILFPPEAKGSWFPIFYGIRKMRLHQREQRKNLASILSYFRKGAESLPDATILCDAEGHVLWCNQHAQHLLGLKWPQDKEQQILNLIRLPDFSAYLKKGNYEHPITLACMPKKYLEFRVSYPYIENNLLIIARDITKTIKLEKTRTNFFANVSHEIRIPLTVLQGYIELLNQNKKLSELEQKAYSSMEAQVIRLKEMSKQLTTLSRIESTPSTTTHQQVDVAKIIHNIYQDFQIQNTKKQTITINTNKTLFVIGDEEQLKQAITNLFYNAVEHNEQGAQIDISWQIKKNHPESNNKLANFSIKDNGIGIAAEHLAHLTERFYRVDTARARDTGTGGTGLGLAIVKHALHNHHSTLQITSTKGQGSTFEFDLTACK